MAKAERPFKALLHTDTMRGLVARHDVGCETHGIKPRQADGVKLRQVILKAPKRAFSRENETN